MVGRCGVVSNIKCISTCDFLLVTFHRSWLVEFPYWKKSVDSYISSIVEDDRVMYLCIPSLVPCGCQLSDYSLHHVGQICGTNST